MPKDGWDSHWGVQVPLVMTGLGMLVLGSTFLVEAAIAIARGMGVSELVVGLTIVAAGTSLPEVATSIMATVRGERDIAIGNVVGSNTFNILAVQGASSLVAHEPLAVAPSVLAFDLPVMRRWPSRACRCSLADGRSRAGKESSSSATMLRTLLI